MQLPMLTIRLVVGPFRKHSCTFSKYIKEIGSGISKISLILRAINLRVCQNFSIPHEIKEIFICLGYTPHKLPNTFLLPNYIEHFFEAGQPVTDSEGLTPNNNNLFLQCRLQQVNQLFGQIFLKTA